MLPSRGKWIAEERFEYEPAWLVIAWDLSLLFLFFAIVGAVVSLVF